MRTFVVNSYNAVMDADINPLSKIPDNSVRHVVMQILAWMWCIVFSMYMGSIFVMGVTMIAHVMFLAAIVVTVATFETAKNNPKAFKLRLEHKTNGYHTPSRTRYMYYNGKRIELDKNDPGGEHE